MVSEHPQIGAFLNKIPTTLFKFYETYDSRLLALPKFYCAVLQRAISRIVSKGTTQLMLQKKTFFKKTKKGNVVKVSTQRRYAWFTLYSVVLRCTGHSKEMQPTMVGQQPRFCKPLHHN